MKHKSVDQKENEDIKNDLDGTKLPAYCTPLDKFKLAQVKICQKLFTYPGKSSSLYKKSPKEEKEKLSLWQSRLFLQKLLTSSNL